MKKLVLPLVYPKELLSIFFIVFLIVLEVLVPLSSFSVGVPVSCGYFSVLPRSLQHCHPWQYCPFNLTVVGDVVIYRSHGL